MGGDNNLALVVDDEAPLRKLIALALQREGFRCEQAADGEEAERLIGRQTYDVVITDLRMPRKHGHALVTTLLQLKQRPIVIVHTGVLETRLAKDLLARGVDDIFFKPSDFGLMAAKVKALITRRRKSEAVSKDACPREEYIAGEDEDAPGKPVSLSLLERKVRSMARLLPISNVAMAVYDMSTSNDSEVTQIARALQADGSLVAELLRLANSSFYNASGERIIDIEKAIIRVGRKRVGEIALATNVLAAITPGMLPWMDVDLTWKRSMAAGLALDLLVESGRQQSMHQGLLLSAIMQPIGRVVLGALFPRQYEAIIAACRQQGDTLLEQERRIFPLQHTDIMAQLLAGWNVPADVYLPLRLSLADYPSLAHQAEPTRSRAELVKLAILAGRLAVDRWQSWDFVQFPPPGVLKRLRIDNFAEIVARTRESLQGLSRAEADGGWPAPADKQSKIPQRRVAYCNLAADENSVSGEGDAFPLLLRSMGLIAEPCDMQEIAAGDRPAIINCLGAYSTRFATLRGRNPNLVIISDADRRELFARFAPTVIVPNSFGRLQSDLRAELSKRRDASSASQTPATAGAS